MKGKQIRVLVVDDSPTCRSLLTEILASDPEITVVGQANDGVDAVSKAVKLAPDLITMDVAMPGMDGLEATKEIMISAPTPILVVSASGNRNVMDLSFDATQAGALMVVSKPDNPQSERFEEKRAQLIAMVKAMSQVKVVRRWSGEVKAGRSDSPSTEHLAYDGRPKKLGRVVAIGTSTGGPAALRRVLMDLPGTFKAPIVVVQHIAKGFVEGLAGWLTESCRLHVKVASDGETLAKHNVYLAPDDRHLGVTAEGKVRLSDAPPIGGFRPSATFLFETVAQVYGPSAIALVLTGMGSDGVVGLKALHQSGGKVLAQDEVTSVVFGMAQEAVKAGAVHSMLPLDRMASALMELVA